MKLKLKDSQMKKIRKRRKKTRPSRVFNTTTVTTTLSSPLMKPTWRRQIPTASIGPTLKRQTTKG